MIVECISSRGEDLPPGCTDPRTGMGAGTEFPLTIGGRYVVYAITSHLGYMWYYVLNDDDFEYPVWTPGPLFNVVEPTIPSGWHYQYVRYEHGEYPIISFPEWADDPTFYERLVDGDEAAIRAFDRHRF